MSTQHWPSCYKKSIFYVTMLANWLVEHLYLSHGQSQQDHLTVSNLLFDFAIIFVFVSLSTWKLTVCMCVHCSYHTVPSISFTLTSPQFDRFSPFSLSLTYTLRLLVRDSVLLSLFDFPPSLYSLFVDPRLIEDNTSSMWMNFTIRLERDSSSHHIPKICISRQEKRNSLNHFKANECSLMWHVCWFDVMCINNSQNPYNNICYLVFAGLQMLPFIAIIIKTCGATKL